MSRTLAIETAAVFEPLLAHNRYKGAYGGRGSGKSHFFAGALVEDHLRYPGLRSVCIREVQKTIRESSKRLIEDKIQAFGLGPSFEVRESIIRTPGDGSIIFQGMRDQNAESIKSLEGVDRAWVEEAQTLSARSLSILRPTIRKPGSELWFSWNPNRKTDAVDEFLRAKRPADAVVVRANWRDNPWFTDELNRERLLEYENYPERYGHTWEGEYAKAFEGAYYALGLSEAEAQGRITRLVRDPMARVYAVFDIGGAGRNADATAIWVVQFIGQDVFCLDYLEGQGQVLNYYTEELTRRGWGDAYLVVPSDGRNTNNFTGKTYAQHLADAGFWVDEMPPSRPGAVKMRIDTVRRLFPRIWFDDEKTAPGREALGFYHEKRSEGRAVGLGPEHDWSSHCADAFGYMAIYRDAVLMGRRSPEDEYDDQRGDDRWTDTQRSSVTGY